MSRPGILLDRDGTINVDYHYVGHVERVQLIPGAAQAIARFNSAGIPVAIVTNQGGVARGFYPEHNVHEVHDYIARELARHGAHVDLFLYSPHHPEGNLNQYKVYSSYHKPAPGMAYQASSILDLNLYRSWVVGDRITDVELARNIDADCVYLGAEPLPHWYSTEGIYRYPSLAAAAGFIIERITGMSQGEFPTQNYYGVASYFSDYTTEITNVFSLLNLADLDKVAKRLMEAYDMEQGVFVAGNGGSAALASHFACDHFKGVGTEDYWHPQVVDLTSNTSLITAIANDIGYDAIFSYQIERQATENDVLVTFSVSGNSGNIVRAIQCAKEMGMATISIVSLAGGKAATMSDITVHIPSGNYGVVEDAMQVIMHSLAQFIRQHRMQDDEIHSVRF